MTLSKAGKLEKAEDLKEKINEIEVEIERIEDANNDLRIDISNLQRLIEEKKKEIIENNRLLDRKETVRLNLIDTVITLEEESIDPAEKLKDMESLLGW